MEIILKPTDKKNKVKSVKISAPIDPRTNEVWYVDEDMKKNFIDRFNITPLSRYDLIPFIPIRKDDDFKMGWLKIAEKLKVVRKATEKYKVATFEIEDVEIEATNAVKERQSKYEAIKAVENLSHQQKIELYKILGYNGTGLSLDVLTNALYDICETNPSTNSHRNYQTILDILKDKDYNYKLLVAEMIFAGKIEGKEGKYYYVDTYLGTTKGEIVDWAKQKINKDIVDSWKMFLKPIKDDKE